MTWIKHAMSMSGVMTVKQLKGGSFLALMQWPNVTMPIVGNGPTPMKAIENLNTALEDDCAQEMIDKGEV